MELHTESELKMGSCFFANPYPRPLTGETVGSELEKFPRRRQIRLARSVYEITGQPVLVTVCTRERKPVISGTRCR